MDKFNYKVGCNLKLQLLKKKKGNITIYFENLIVRLYFLYALNTFIKFCTNQKLFII